MYLQKRSGIIIPKTLENRDFYSLIKRHLTRVTREYNNNVEPRILKFYVEGSNFLLIPRFFPIEEYVKDLDIVDDSPEGEDISIEHNIEARDELQKNIINFFENNSCGVVQAKPGSGKTVVSIHKIATLKKKAFILVHREALSTQWKDDFLEFTNLKDDDIAILSSKSYKEDLTKPIIISTDQTFGSLLKRKPKEFIDALKEANIGIFIADEVHTSVGAPTFSMCSIFVPAKYVYGLSATPYRYDGNSDIIHYHLGELFIPEGKASVVPAKVTVILSSFGIVSNPKTRKYIYWDGTFQRARYLNQIRKSIFLEKISKSLLDKFMKEDRKVVYVSERIKLLNDIYDWYTGDKSLFIAGSSKDALKNQVTFTTPGKMRDGVDIPEKNCLIMTSPISNIEQMAGRVVRICKNKNIASIIDLVDIDCQDISRTLFNRIKYYENEKWEVQYILINENGTQVIGKDKALEIIGIVKEENKNGEEKEYFAF